MWSCCIALRISCLVNGFVHLANFVKHFEGSLRGCLTLLIHSSQIQKSFISDGCLPSSLAGNGNDFFYYIYLASDTMPCHACTFRIIGVVLAASDNA